MAVEPASPEAANAVRLVLRRGAGSGETGGQDEPDLFGDESYRLVIDANGVTVTAPAPAGLFYGTQTLSQLLPPAATVMSWRGMEGGIEAARQGHDVIMTPTSHCYFDYYQAVPENEPLAIGGLTPLAKVYELEPVPEKLTAEEARHILGAQGNVWTEYMKTAEYVEYMVFPRLLALAEVVWSPREARDWDCFRARLGGALERLDALGVRPAGSKSPPRIPANNFQFAARSLATRNW